MNNIEVKCRNCGSFHPVFFIKNIPKNTQFISSNWCQNCIDTAKGVYTISFENKNKIKKNTHCNSQIKLF